MTTIASNGGRKTGKEKKMQSNKSNMISTVNTEIESNTNTNNKIKGDSKLQPTAEQIRIANLMNDKMDDGDLKDKIDQIIELTGSSRDEAVVALHDCDNDTAKAIDKILEGDNIIDSEWKSISKKKKTPKSNDDSKPDANKDAKSETHKERDPLKSVNKSEKPSGRGPRNAGPPRLQKANALANKVPRRNKSERNDASEDQNNDIFSASSQSAFKSDPTSRRNDRRSRGRGGGRSLNRGFGGPSGRGSRTFQNRGLQNNDGFNSIDTWTNSTADQPSKPVINTDVNTMAVGNWSDIANNEDWSEEDWDSNHMETKVFTPSTKALAEKDELLDMSANINSNSTSQSMSYSLLVKPSVDSSHQTMSSILSSNISRPSSVSASGAALLQQLQQSNTSQSPSLHQYTLSQYNKQATESIKSLVGLSTSGSYNSNSDLLSSSDRDLTNSLSNAQASHLTNKARMKNVRSSSKIPESAVEMPTNDSIASLGVQFGALEFGTDKLPFSLGNDSSVFQEAVNHVTSKVKSSEQSSSLTAGSLLSTASDANFRSSTNSNLNDNSNKVGSSMMQNSVLAQSLTSDSILESKGKSNVGPYGQKVGNSGKTSSDNYVTPSPQPSVNVNDMTSAYKSTYSSDSSYSTSATNYSTPSTSSYYSASNSQTGQYGNQSVNNYSSNFATNAMTNHSGSQKLLDNSSQQKQYDITNMVTNAAQVGSMGLISNSTVTTNVLKNTLSATGKGMHSVPPGVATPVLSAPYMLSNAAGLPIQPVYPFPYDVQFQAPTRDHSFTYAPQDVKYSRQSDSDVTSVSSSQNVGAPSQTHSQAFVNNVTFPPGYGFYFTTPSHLMPQNIYGTAATPIYPVTPATNTGSAGSAFPKANSGYGSHSYNSGYDSISAVAQTQDYVKQAYGQSVQQHSKGLNNSSSADLSGANSAIYGKSHTQMTKNYDKQFQTNTPQPFNLNAGAQSAALGTASYGQPYILPHNQASISLHHTLQADATQGNGSGVSSQRSIPQTHKGPSGSGGYAKYNWA